MESSATLEKGYPCSPMSGREIRLVEISHTASSRGLVFNFVTTDLDDPCHYDALSWTWGLPVLDYQDSGNFGRCPITSNLLSFLGLVSHTAPGARWWIDALCINQEDNEEKDQQIWMMANIYEKAQRVIVWLGQADTDSDIAMRLMSRVYMLRHAIQKEVSDESGHLDNRKLQNLGLPAIKDPV